MIPARIPMNGFAILLNASVLVALSAIAGIKVVTTPVERRFVIINQDARAASAAVPSLSSAIPTPTPITNRIAMLSINAPPAFTRKNPIISRIPVTSPPCMVDGHNAYPIPIKIPQIGRQATGSINAFPSFCKYFIILSSSFLIIPFLFYASYFWLKYCFYFFNTRMVSPGLTSLPVIASTDL